MEQGQTQSPVTNLFQIATVPNLVDQFYTTKIGRDVVRLAKLDDDSREEWLKTSEEAMKLALQVAEQKTTPWPGASNVKYPLITVAALQFHARAYPAIISGNKVVKPQITGEDPDGAKGRQGNRIANHMNYQLLEENEDWEPEMDGLLFALPIEGCEFKKSYFCPESGFNKSEWVRPENLIVHDKTKSLKTCPRITHRLYFYPHEIDDKVRAGVWADVDLQISADDYEEETLQEFYEQHTFLDLDDDGFKEPYIVTVHKDSESVVRLRAGFYVEDIVVEFNGTTGPVGGLMRAAGQKEMTEEGLMQILSSAKLVKVPRIEMFTKYSFIPNPSGSFYDIGFGQLVGPLNNSVDTTINQLLDAGTLANRQAGFIHDGVSIDRQRGAVQFEVGEFKPIKVPSGRSIGDAVFQLKFNDPSMVLFNLLGTIIQASKDVTSVQDIMTGGPNPAGNRETATTSMIRIQEGVKVFSAIYKRIYRALKVELKKLFKLNSRYLQPQVYFTVVDSQEVMQTGLFDYQGDGTDVQPVADPQLATPILAMAKTQAIMGVIQHPLVSDEEVLKRFFEAHELPNPERLFVPQEQRQPQPDPELMLKAQIAASEHVKRQSEIVANYAKALKDIANAESQEVGIQLQAYAAGLKSIIDSWNGQGNSGNMAQFAGNQGSIGQGAGIPESGGMGLN